MSPSVLLCVEHEDDGFVRNSLVPLRSASVTFFSRSLRITVEPIVPLKRENLSATMQISIVLLSTVAVQRISRCKVVLLSATVELEAPLVLPFRNLLLRTDLLIR